MGLTRRDMLLAGLFGTGCVGLRALASGVPRRVLLDPLAPASARAADLQPPAILILSTSSAGDPLNGNVPGTYGRGLEDVKHPLNPIVAPRQFLLAGQQVTGAKPWANLPASLRDQLVFFHHRTSENVHPNHARMMRVAGSVRANEMLVSAFAKRTAPRLGTTQEDPLSLGATGGGELISSGGRILPNVTPQGIRTALSGAGGALGHLLHLRDDTVDALHNLYRTEGLFKHQRMLDTFARTRDEARTVDDTLLDQLESVTGRSEDRIRDQVRAAPVLAAMNVAPVISIRLYFGGDNHADEGLEEEAHGTVSGVAHLQELWESVQALKGSGALRAEVVVACLNVFGRTLSLKRKGVDGRDHNANHHCMVVFGSGLRGSVVGGVVPQGQDWGASAIDAATGSPDPDGDIPQRETFQSAAKTLGAALGIDRSALEEEIEGGEVIARALRATSPSG